MKRGNAYDITTNNELRVLPVETTKTNYTFAPARLYRVGS
jgi:hypothetical protein